MKTQLRECLSCGSTFGPKCHEPHCCGKPALPIGLNRHNGNQCSRCKRAYVSMDPCAALCSCGPSVSAVATKYLVESRGDTDSECALLCSVHSAAWLKARPNDTLTQVATDLECEECS